ncbi:MAG TPA: hypothetical protein VKV02_14520 [Acidobacteriaceae bacterium]|nr:hypothetical protein [Acidobacteriaceae bacterium]
MTGVERVFEGPTAAFIVSAAGDELQLVDQDDLVRIIRDGLRVLPPADREAVLRQAAAEAGLRVLSAEQAEDLLPLVVDTIERIRSAGGGIGINTKRRWDRLRILQATLRGGEATGR